MAVPAVQFVGVNDAPWASLTSLAAAPPHGFFVASMPMVIAKTSFYVPGRIGIFAMMEHVAPGGIPDTWPDNQRPQMRVPLIVTAPHVSRSPQSNGYAAGRTTVRAYTPDVTDDAQPGTANGTSTVLGVGAASTAADGAGSSDGASAVAGIASSAVTASSAGDGTAAGTSPSTAIGTTLSMPGGRTAILYLPVTDDLWSGTLTFLWTQVSGPATALITSPTSQSSAASFPNVTGTYIFSLTVTNRLYSGHGMLRVVISSSTAPLIPTPKETGTVLLTIAGVQQSAIINTSAISETTGAALNTCAFSVFNRPVVVGQDVILTRGTIRLFAGIALSVKQFRTWRQGSAPQWNIWYSVSAVGYEWFFKRRQVNKTYTNTSGTDIAKDLISMVPGFTAFGVEANLPILAEFIAKGTVGDSLTALGLATERDWRVTYYKDVHLAAFEDSANDPQPLTEGAGSNFADPSTEFDLSQVVTRVRVSGTTSGVDVVDPTWNGELEINDVTGYSWSGGDAIWGGKPIHYQGIRKDYKYLIAGSRSPVWVGVYNGSDIAGVSYYDVNAALEPGIRNYAFTVQTRAGESNGVMGTQLQCQGTTGGNTNNALRIKVRPSNFIEYPPLPDLITSLNVYRQIPSSAGAGQGFRFIGSVPIAGGFIYDILSDADVNWEFTKQIPEVDTSTEFSYFLTAVTGISGPSSTLVAPVPFTEVVDDLAAQAIIGGYLGGSDDGVIEAPLNVGESTRENARAKGAAFLAERSSVNLLLAYSTFDPKSHPNQRVFVNLPTVTGIVDDFGISQVTITGFEQNVPTAYNVTASKMVPLTRFEDIVRQLIAG